MLGKIFNLSNLSGAYMLRYLVIVFHYIQFLILIKPFLKKCGRRSIVRRPLLITPEYITLGNKVYIMPDCRIEGIPYYAGNFYTPSIIFEDGVSLQQNCHITAATKLVIGKDTMISFNVSIQDTDHEYRNIGLPVANQTLNVKQTRIGKNCFIGSGAKIQAGTILGNHCIVGTNAVVRGVFPDFSVIVGVPARIVKRYNIRTKQWEKTNDRGEFLSDL